MMNVLKKKISVIKYLQFVYLRQKCVETFTCKEYGDIFDQEAINMLNAIKKKWLLVLICLYKYRI